MKNFCFQWLGALLLLGLPVLLSAQGNPARGVAHFPGSATFNHVIGAFSSKSDACTIAASKELDGANLEYIVFALTKGSDDWVLTESGTIQQAGFHLNLCFPNTKKIMVVLTCQQKNGGSVSFNSKKCDK